MRERSRKSFSLRLADCALAAGALLLLVSQTAAASTLAFTTDPNVPVFTTLALNGTAQTKYETMSTWTVNDATGSGSGWNVTVVGNSASLKSAVFKEYCTDGTATNGCSTAVSGGPGPGYVTSSPKSLAANSLTLNSTSASFTAGEGASGDPPTHSCGSPCNVDSATAVKIASAAVDGGLGTWTATGYGASSLALSLPTTVKAIGITNKVYRVDLTWSLNSGP